MFLLTILGFLAISIFAFAATLWLQVHWRSILSWLFAPFRVWTGLDETAGPKL